MTVYSKNLKIKHWNIIYRGEQMKCGRQVREALRPNTCPSSCSSTNILHSQSRLSRDPFVHSDVLRFTENRNRKEETARVDSALAPAVYVYFQLRTAAFKAYCAIWVRRSNFGHQASPRVSPRESTQRRKAELWARNVREFCLNADLRSI